MSPLRSTEDTALEDGALPDRPSDAQPHAPRVGRRGADAERERTHHGATGQVYRSAVDALGFLVVEAVIHRTADDPEPHVQGLVADRQDLLDVPQVARAQGPVAADAHLAQFEARETARAAELEEPVRRQCAAREVRTAR